MFNSSEWTFPLLNQYHDEIEKLAHEYELNTYPNQIEVITAEQMLDAYSSSGMPLNYSHWSFGKKFINLEKHYRRGHMGLAYEIVINSDPCIAYLMEENTMTMQVLVMAHACFGHNSFFKNNYLFKSWTNADAIIDYLLFAKNFIQECEEKYGQHEVEQILDACHALSNYGVDRYKRPSKLSVEEEKKLQQEREAYLQGQLNDLWRTVPNPNTEKKLEENPLFPNEPQENILYFIEKNAPLLHSWQREIIRIVRKLAQYYYPQRQTQVMNEGWACFWHYRLMNDLYNKKLLNDGSMLEFIESHSNVIYQPSFNSQYYSGINPYTLGFNMFQDIKRICDNPTKEDCHYFPDIANSNWRETLEHAMQNFKDESFILQYLSPKLIRDLKLFNLYDHESKQEFHVTDIHNEAGYVNIRQYLSNNYNLSSMEPNIQIFNVNIKTDRSLTIKHIPHQNRPIDIDTSKKVLKYIHDLWKFPVNLESTQQNGKQNETKLCYPNNV